MSHQEILAELEKRSIRKRILHAGVGDLPQYVAGAKVGFEEEEEVKNQERKETLGGMLIHSVPAWLSCIVLLEPFSSSVG